MQTLEQLRAGALAGCQRLKLACGLTEFPPEIFSLAETLEILDLSGNQLSSLPEDLPRLQRLRILFCSDNQFTTLPEVLGQCPALTMIGFKSNRIETVPAQALPPRLRWLILTDNRIEALPDELGRCQQLQKLMLAGNRLRALPESLAACTRLELLRIAANQLSALPAWLLDMPRLAWLAYAGNPFAAPLESAALNNLHVPQIARENLTLHQVLGEGASGIIYRADRHPVAVSKGQAAVQPVAVKCFKGAVTSDGLPQCEMAACLTAGEHPNLIPVLGRLADSPAGEQGLVMALIDPDFANLAGPPSLESCTRDIYPPETCFTSAVALRIARGIAAVAAHLHQRGLMHGDLYGHNILHCGAGRVVIGDFGAASFYTAGSAGQGLERLEVRAFGCLLEELLARLSPTDETALPESAHRALIALVADCLSETPATRPLFAEIVARLARLAGESLPD